MERLVFQEFGRGPVRPDYQKYLSKYIVPLGWQIEEYISVCGFLPVYLTKTKDDLGNPVQIPHLYPEDMIYVNEKTSNASGLKDWDVMNKNNNKPVKLCIKFPDIGPCMSNSMFNTECGGIFNEFRAFNTIRELYLASIERMLDPDVYIYQHLPSNTRLNQDGTRSFQQLINDTNGTTEIEPGESGEMDPRNVVEKAAIITTENNTKIVPVPYEMAPHQPTPCNLLSHYNSAEKTFYSLAMAVFTTPPNTIEGGDSKRPAMFHNMSDRAADGERLKTLRAASSVASRIAEALSQILFAIHESSMTIPPKIHIPLQVNMEIAVIKEGMQLGLIDQYTAVELYEKIAGIAGLNPDATEEDARKRRMEFIDSAREKQESEKNKEFEFKREVALHKLKDKKQPKSAKKAKAKKKKAVKKKRKARSESSSDSDETPEKKKPKKKAKSADESSSSKEEADNKATEKTHASSANDDKSGTDSTPASKSKTKSKSKPKKKKKRTKKDSDSSSSDSDDSSTTSSSSDDDSDSDSDDSSTSSSSSSSSSDDSDSGDSRGKGKKKKSKRKAKKRAPEKKHKRVKRTKESKSEQAEDKQDDKVGGSK
jgi:hypothetical protein